MARQGATYLQFVKISLRAGVPLRSFDGAVPRGSRQVESRCRVWPALDCRLQRNPCGLPVPQLPSHSGSAG